MMKKGFLFITTFVLFLAAFSCGKESAVGGGSLDSNPEEASGEGSDAVDPSEPVAPGTFRAISEGPEYDAAKEQTRAYTQWPGGGLSKFDVYWKNEDLVKIYYDRTGESSGVYKASVTGQTKIAPLSIIDDGDVDNESGSYWAVSPSSAAVSFFGSTFTLRLPSEQTCKGNGAENCDQTALLMVAKCGPERELYFKQTVSFIRLGFNTDLLEGFYCSKVEIESATNYLTGDFTVSYSGSKPVPSAISANGSKKLTLIIRGTNFVSGNYVYAFLPTGTYPSDDLTFTFTITNGSATYYVTKTSAAEVVFARAKYYMIGFTMPSFTDLGSKAYTGLASNQTANCYVVNTPGYYCFDAATRGNGVVTNGATAASVGATITGAASAAAYHSDGTDFIDGDFTSGGFLYANGKVYFKTTASLSAAGNKLVSVKDGSGNTLWSWHIWCNDDLADIKFKSKEDSQYYTFMNMNLGAHQVVFADAGGNGYYYQWGRKDPFQQDKNTLTTPFVNSWSTQGSLANTILHPETIYGIKSELEAAGTTFYTDWWCAGLTTANMVPYGENNINAYTPVASFSKTMFDPCPPGYHVPTMAALYGFRANTFTSADGVTTIKDADNTTIIFPLVYLRQPNVAAASWGNTSCYTWSCYPGAVNGRPSTADRSAPRFWITPSGSGYNNQSVDRRFCCVIRCQKD